MNKAALVYLMEAGFISVDDDDLNYVIETLENKGFKVQNTTKDKEKVYVLIFEPDRGCEEYEGNDYEIKGVFKTKELAEKFIEKDIKKYHFSCEITKLSYDIEEREVQNE